MTARLLPRLRGALLGLVGLVGVGILAAAAVHLVWLGVAGESPAFRDALESLSRWVDDPARDGALALLGIGFVLVSLLSVALALTRLGEPRIRVATHGRARADVDRESLARAIERALQHEVTEKARVSISRRRRVNVTLRATPGGSVEDAATRAREAVEDWCAAHGVPCRGGRITVEQQGDDTRVDPSPRKRERQLK